MADTISSAITSNYSLPPTTTSSTANPQPPQPPFPHTFTTHTPPPPTPPPATVATSSRSFRHPVNTIQVNDSPVLEVDNCEELSDEFMGNYMQLFENKVLNNGILHNCTLNIKNFNITIQK